MILHQPIKYHGGKHFLAKEIIKLFPENFLHYVECYFGGGSVLLQKPYGNCSEVVNDINMILMNFWTVLQSEYAFKCLKRKLEATPISEPLFNEAFQAIKNDWMLTPVDLAYYFFILARQSRQGLQKSFTTLSKNRLRRGIQESSASWLSAIEGLPEIHDRLKGVVIYSKNAIEVIKEQDSINTFLYIDPPYLLSTRISKKCYKYEMTYEQHEELLKTLSNIQGKFILSGYNNDLYEKYARDNNWNIKIIDIDNKASSKKIKDIKQEYLWFNYNI